MKKRFSLVLLLIIWIQACETKRERISETTISQNGAESEEAESPDISFYFYEEKSEFPDAIIEMHMPLGNQKFKPGKIPFEFNIKNYPFADGLKGFQLKLILNSGDPVGYNMPIFQKELKEGTYRAVAYLVDEEGLALKEFGNYVDRDFMVGDTRPFPYSDEPFIVLNLPMHRQTYQEGEEVIMDFLVLGGDMRQDGLKVVVQVEDYSYEVNEMTPVRISNLTKGEYSIRVKLLNKDGKELEGPFSSVGRTIVME